METENPKPQTGGLKLMTVFIVVLLLHVAVIGGISAYHLLKGNAGDALAQEGTPAVETTQPASKDPVVAQGEVPGENQAPVSAVQPADDTFLNTPAQSTAEQLVDNAKPPVATAPQPTVGVESVTPETATTATEKEYAVAKGDTLSRIARAHGMKVAQLREINGLKNDNLKIGQKLKVTGEAKKEAATTTVAASTLTPTVKAEVKASALAAASYKVSKGDTLAKIARQFNTTPTALMAANKITDPTKLKIGAVLVIPGSASRNQLSEQKDGQQPFKPVKPDHGDLVMVKP